MAREQKQKFCQHCQAPTLHVKSEPKGQSCSAQAFLTVVTCGLWLPIWILLVSLDQWAGILAPWHCQTCGKKN